MRDNQEDDIGFLAVKYPDYLTNHNHNHSIIHVLDDLVSDVYTRGFGNGLHEGIV
jgi:hypothetical protein